MFIFSVYFLVVMRIGRKKKEFPPHLCSSEARGSLWHLRGFLWQFLHWTHTVRFLTGFPNKICLLYLTGREGGTGFVISMCSFTCMHCARDSRVPGAVVACFYLNIPFAQSRAPPFPFCHAPIIQGFSVCLFTNHSKPRKAHLNKWNDLNL